MATAYRRRCRSTWRRKRRKKMKMSTVLVKVIQHVLDER
jgi:hypothetical protein